MVAKVTVPPAPKNHFARSLFKCTSGVVPAVTLAVELPKLILAVRIELFGVVKPPT